MDWDNQNRIIGAFSTGASHYQLPSEENEALTPSKARAFEVWGHGEQWSCCISDVGSQLIWTICNASSSNIDANNFSVVQVSVNTHAVCCVRFVGIWPSLWWCPMHRRNWHSHYWLYWKLQELVNKAIAEPCSKDFSEYPAHSDERRVSISCFSGSSSKKIPWSRVDDTHDVAMSLCEPGYLSSFAHSLQPNISSSSMSILTHLS